MLGDFNDEPFNRSISARLRASRDRGLVLKKPNDFLYNPFWRHLGEAQPYPEGPGRPEGAGTFFRRQGKLSRWFTYDQAFVSSSLLSGATWELDEANTRPVRFREVLDLITSRSHDVDHLPIVVTLRRATPTAAARTS